MELILKQIKTDLKQIRKDNNWKFKHINNHFQEILEYTDYYSLNRKKHFLTMRFILQKKENSLSFNYHYVFSSKNFTIDETHSFAESTKDLLPGINPVDREKLRLIYRYEVEEKAIKNQISLDDQVKTVMEVFKANYPAIINHVKSFTKTNKIPE